jgi:hypothetical protein
MVEDRRHRIRHRLRHRGAASRTAKWACGSPRPSVERVGGLAVELLVQACDLDVRGDAEAADDVDDLKITQVTANV